MSICYNPFSLEGKTILVTGASSGIGKGTALECARLGARLIVTGRNVERLKETLQSLPGEGHLSIVADLTDSEDLKAMVKNMPMVDGAVFCAGQGHMATVKFAKYEFFQKIFEINFFSQTELFRLLLKGKKLNKRSSCVFIDSVGGSTAFFLGNVIYGSSKAALRSFVKYAASELGPNSIRVNAILPGMTNTPLINSGTFTDEDFKTDMAKYPLGRYGEPQDIAFACVYLLSDAASWVTGSDLVVDGGFSILH